MKQQIRLTESQINRIIRESIENVLDENEMDEGIWNNLVSGAKSAFGKGVGDDTNRNNGGINLQKRWNAAKAGYNARNTTDQIDNVVNYLRDLIEQGKIDPNQTVEQLVYSVGGGNRFGKGNLSTLRAQANSRASKAQNNIYR